jgi:hypothetical protein
MSCVYRREDGGKDQERLENGERDLTAGGKERGRGGGREKEEGVGEQRDSPWNKEEIPELEEELHRKGKGSLVGR